jgi:two-component system response regulator AtoC
MTSGALAWHHRRVSDASDSTTVPARERRPPPRRRTLLVLDGDRIDPRQLPLHGALSVGRAESNDVRIDHPSISRRHLVLRLTEDSIAVIDEGGSNGVKLRGTRIPRGVAVEISANEDVQVGDVTLVVQELRPLVTTTSGEHRPSGTVATRPSAPVVLAPEMRRLYELASRVARGTISVLLVGETGTGKEILAEFIHRASPRAGGPLVRVNCAALGESLVESELFGHEKGAFTGAQQERRGLIEAAAGGTVMLDEVGELPLAIQAKLLRVLEDREVLRVGSTTPRTVDVRFVAATNRDLDAAVEAGTFRRDLYYRLAGAVLAIPPLRERSDEIVALAQAFVAAAAARLDRAAPRLAEDVLVALVRHSWPGNARELRNLMERAVLLADDDRLTMAHVDLGGATSTPTPRPTHVPAAMASSAPLAAEHDAMERQRILDALATCNGNQTRAAELLGMPRRTLVKRLGQYGVPRPRKP